jgi:diaminopropionate ammonia-lyase
MDFHRRLPGYAPTRLIELPTLARRLGVGRVWLKEETSRFGLPAFKALGAWWAGYRALSGLIGGEPRDWRTVGDLAEAFASLRPLTLATATDGNHGRAVARFARQLGFQARIIVPSGVEEARIAAIRGEGGAVEVLAGSYEDAILAAADLMSPDCLVLADVSWPGYEDVPHWISDGYATVFQEADGQLKSTGADPADVVVVPIGVGTLAAAATMYYRRPELQMRPRLLGVEPLTAAGALESVRAGRLTEAAGPHDSILTPLNCGLPSPEALPFLTLGMEGFAAIADSWVVDAMRRLAGCGVVAGPAGAAGLAALLELSSRRDALSDAMLRPDTSVLLLCTEGLVDPDGYRRIVGSAAREVVAALDHVPEGETWRATGP